MSRERLFCLGFEGVSALRGRTSPLRRVLRLARRALFESMLRPIARGRILNSDSRNAILSESDHGKRYRVGGWMAGLAQRANVRQAISPK